jgi:hypothetical protein
VVDDSGVGKRERRPSSKEDIQRLLPTKETVLHGGVFVEVRRSPRGVLAQINESSSRTTKPGVVCWATAGESLGAERGRLVCRS